jgi:DNA polymerase-3 subunit gamma/tau
VPDALTPDAQPSGREAGAEAATAGQREQDGAQQAGDAAAPAPIAVVELAEMIDIWPAVVELVSAGHALCGAVIADARPVELSGRDLTVGFPTGAAFLKKKAEDPSNRTIVAEALRELTGGRWQVSYELCEHVEAGAGAQRGGYSEDEWVARFKAELDAEELPRDPDEQAHDRDPLAGERKEA